MLFFSLQLRLTLNLVSYIKDISEIKHDKLAEVWMSSAIFVQPQVFDGSRILCSGFDTFR